MSVNLVDPNLLNTNQGFVNGIPQYQDMFIFAELTARSRGRTVLETNNTGQYSISKNGSQDEININFIGNNQNKSATDPNYLKFTTNWYDGSAAEGLRYEGFGISSIKVVINSSFVPQVNIQFIDVRGLAFFNQTDSPYRVLFYFPPPIFTLTIKGYYGMALIYKLHLVKYTSEFKAENGNFIIDAQFVAMTFAPLTDVLFRYVVNFPLLPNRGNAPINISPSPNTPPINTYDLILKLKNLYAASADKQNTEIDSRAYDNAINKKEAIRSVFSSLFSFGSSTTLTSEGNPLALASTFNEITSINNISPMESITEYNKIIEQFAVSGYYEDIPQRLLIGYFVSRDYYTGREISTINGEITISPFLTEFDPIQTKLDKLNEYRKGLINQVDNSGFIVGAVDDADIQEAKSIPSSSGTYIAIDITKYYVKLYNERTKIDELISAEINTINLAVNQMIQNKLGMKPTIYRIFKTILDDVDIFFRTLRNTSMKAEDYYKNNDDIFTKITSSELYKDTQKQIFAFPLVVKRQNVCNTVKETRIMPKALSTPDNPLPEMELVQDFVNTFILQRNITEQIDMRNTVNAEGVSVWIPISPFDSNLGTNVSYSPYAGVDSDSSAQPVGVSEYNKLVLPLIIMLKRFYILSQFAYPNKFYVNNNGKKSTEDGNNDYITMFAESEAINMAISIFNPIYIGLLKTFAKNYTNTTQIKDLIPEPYTFPAKTYPFFSLVDGPNLPTGSTTYSSGDAYVDKNNALFHGFIFSDEAIILQEKPDTSRAAQKIAESGNNKSNPISTFQIKSTRKWTDFFKETKVESTLRFSSENIVFIPDVTPDGTGESGDNKIKTRFLTNKLQIKTGNTYQEDSIGFNAGANASNSDFKYENRVKTIEHINKDNAGNSVLIQTSRVTNPSDVFTDMIDVWSSVLAVNDTQIYDTIINPTTPENKELSKIVLASSFGYALSTFNIFPSSLNKDVFSLPAAVDIPTFLGYYMGSLVITDGNPRIYEELYNFFVLGAGRNINSSGVLIFADIVDINNQMAEADRELLRNEYINGFAGSGTYDLVVSNLKFVCDKVNYEDKKVAAAKKIGKTEYIAAKYAAYKELLNSDFNQYIIQPLMERNCIVNYSEMTFQRNVISNPLYLPLSVTDNDSKKKNFNANYFKQFFKYLSAELENKEKQRIEQKKEDDKLVGDEDILTQTYYSFKNINDKWLSSPTAGDKISGYPSFSDTPIGPLINSFAFVDRAMNPIGDTIINPEILIQLFDDPNVSVFSVLSQLLSMNGFEFFPLQNFMSYEPKDWINCFKIDTQGNLHPRPAFVCMYIGGSSSYPTGIESFGGQFKDDGIDSIVNVGDFNIGDCKEGEINDDDNQLNTNPNFPWKEVRAFRVRFGEQNQSMFTDIKIDSKEYPETNESIQILSRIAGDNKLQAPPPKGQNLYNLYENRSYKATITGLGNATIQPTQYFQLENVPMFSGSYVILSVEHNIEPNKMTTSFSGTKILKYPIPRVLQPSVILGFDGGNSDDTNSSDSSNANITAGTQPSDNEAKAQFNSMYDFKIR